MSSSTAIGRVSASLRNLLVGEMSLTPDVPITILAPDETGVARRVNLFLYQIRENPNLRNADWRVNPANSAQLLPPPLSLNLFYLMTPYAANDAVSGNSAAHEILGDAMRVFREFPILPATYLEGDLTQANEEIRIVQDTVNVEELSHLWGTFSQPFRLSVLYEVSVVQLDAGGGARALPNRVRSVGVDVDAPIQPPIVETASPQSAPAGATITFSGRHLDGWSAYVRMLGRQLLDAHQISGDSFDVVIPGDLTSGLYQIRVDVSNLHRATFLFEVTP